MNETKLRTTVGIVIVLSHFGLLFFLLLLTVAGKFTPSELLLTLGLVLPLFAAYSTAVIRNFLASKGDDQQALPVTSQRVFVSLLLPALAVAFLITVVAWKAFGPLGFDDFCTLVGVTETAFGLYIGYVVKSLFPEVSSSSRRRREKAASKTHDDA